MRVKNAGFSQPLLCMIKLVHMIMVEIKTKFQLNMYISLFFFPLNRVDYLKKWILLPPKNIQLKNG